MTTAYLFDIQSELRPPCEALRQYRLSLRIQAAWQPLRGYLSLLRLYQSYILYPIPKLLSIAFLFFAHELSFCAMPCIKRGSRTACKSYLLRRVVLLRFDLLCFLLFCMLARGDASIASLTDSLEICVYISVVDMLLCPSISLRISVSTFPC